RRSGGGGRRRRPDAEPEGLDAATRKTLDQYGQLVRAALLAPLYAATQVSREAPFVYTLTIEGEGDRGNRNSDGNADGNGNRNSDGNGSADGDEAGRSTWRLTLSGRSVT